MEEFRDSLDLGIIELVRRAVSIHAQRVDGRFVTSVESGCRVGTVGNETVNRVCHLVAKRRKLIKRQASLIFAVDLLVTNQSSSYLCVSKGSR